MRKNLRATGFGKPVALCNDRCALTEFQVFLGNLQELSNPGRERFTLDGIASAEEVLADEEGEYINKVGVEGDLLECQIINWKKVSM